MTKINPYLLLSLLCAVLYIPGVFQLPVIDRDEAHFAQATKQMLQTHQFFQIRFQEKTRFQKPPGINWIQAASVALFANVENAQIGYYRIPSVMAAFIAVLMTFFFASRFIEKNTALWAAAFLACALLLVVESHMAVIDASLLSAVVIMQGALWILYDAAKRKAPQKSLWALIFWLAMTYGFVLKGVTPLVGGLTMLALCLVDRRVKWLKYLYPLSGLVLFGSLTLLWVLLVNQAENSNYILQMIHKDLLPKLQGGHESHGKPPLFHLLILPLTFWPGSLFLWQGICYGCQHWRQNNVKFVLAWVLPSWLFFELMPTKLPQYVLPTFPAIAILCALGIQAIQSHGRVLRGLQIAWGIMTAAIGASFILIAYYLKANLLTGYYLGLTFTIFAVLSVYYVVADQYRKAKITLLLSAILTFPVVFSIYLPSLESIWVPKIVAKTVASKISSEKPLWVVGYSEPGLVFNLDTDQVRFINLERMHHLIKSNQLEYVLIDSSYFNLLKDKSAFTIENTIEGYNYNKGKWIRLLLLKSNNDSL